MDVEEQSLEDTLSAAWDEVESVEETTDEPADTEASFETAEETSEVEPVEASETSEAEQAPAEGEPAPEPVVAQEAEVEPPRSWNAEGREMWKDLPKEVKDYINLREQQVAQGLEKHRANADRAKAMDQTLAPYQQMFAMGGGAKDTIEGLLQTGAALSMGNPMQRAQTVANIIQRFGVDIPTLDSLLTGEPVPEGVQQTDAIQQAVAQAVAPYQQMQQQWQQAQQQAVQASEQRATSELNQFATDPKNEFFNDVRIDMADIMDAMAARGQDISLQDAYDRACHMNPSIRSIIQKRQQASAIAPKREAAVSVRGTPAGPGGTQPPNTMRDAITAAWEAAGRA